MREEVSIIGGAWAESVVVIDDFQVPDDPDYGFDDYGEGRRLCLEHLRFPEPSPGKVFWPAASSGIETGRRRGCVVLATDDAAAKELETLGSLRKHRGRSCGQ